ncbi:hypothetical protein V5O48_012436 [Marasmius crinis-equi]|uniref:Uncharacterized protein n=1 Tax=Marasmius crinis-equi TaxID=585013 RepID=A0ABR3F382_9AGAR
MVRVDDTSPLLAYTPPDAWFPGGTESEWNFTTHGTRSAGAEMKFVFTGTGIDVILQLRAARNFDIGYVQHTSAKHISVEHVSFQHIPVEYIWFEYICAEYTCVEHIWVKYIHVKYTYNEHTYIEHIYVEHTYVEHAHPTTSNRSGFRS